MTYAISVEGLALIRAHEGLLAEPKPLGEGAWIVGFSHIRVGEPGAPLSPSQAEELLIQDLAPLERVVNELVRRPISQSQFDALVSFAFSVGAEAFAVSQVLRRVNAGDFVAAACAMDAWRKADVAGESVVLEALVRRRTAEKAMFLKDMPHAPAPSAAVRATLDHAASVLGAPARCAATPFVAPAPTEPAGLKTDAARLTEILLAEPDTAALLLTQPAPVEPIEEEAEIVTAHAKPVARPLDEVREARRRRHLPAPVKAGVATRLRQQLEQLDGARTVESFGLIVLMIFGLGLIALAGSFVFDSEGDVAALAGAAALLAPGVAATLLSAVGLLRGPPARPV